MQYYNHIKLRQRTYYNKLQLTDSILSVYCVINYPHNTCTAESKW